MSTRLLGGFSFGAEGRRSEEPGDPASCPPCSWSEGLHPLPSSLHPAGPVGGFQEKQQEGNGFRLKWVGWGTCKTPSPLKPTPTSPCQRPPCLYGCDLASKSPSSRDDRAWMSQAQAFCLLLGPKGTSLNPQLPPGPVHLKAFCVGRGLLKGRSGGPQELSFRVEMGRAWRRWPSHHLTPFLHRRAGSGAHLPLTAQVLREKAGWFSGNRPTAQQLNWIRPECPQLLCLRECVPAS